MKQLLGASGKTLGIGLLLICLSALPALAGSSFDYGQLPGTPASANLVAWVSSAVPPTQVLTEDGYNSALGPNQGYASGFWIVGTTNFDNPPAASGQTLNIVFGGLGGDAGKIWTYSAVLDTTAATTNHGTVGTQDVGTCPVMLSGSQDVTGKTINWSGASSFYLVYRSQNASGSTPPNGYSNGRYNYVATVTGTTYKDTACPTGTQCWHIVIPAALGGAILSCHSDETNPSAVTLSTFRAADPAVNWPLTLAVGLLGLALVVSLIVYRKRAAVHA